MVVSRRFTLSVIAYMIAAQIAKRMTHRIWRHSPLRAAPGALWRLPIRRFASHPMRDGRKAYCYNLSFPSPWVIDILGKLDFDFVLIDGEHGPFGLDQLETSAGAPNAIT